MFLPNTPKRRRKKFSFDALAAPSASEPALRAFRSPPPTRSVGVQTPVPSRRVFATPGDATPRPRVRGGAGPGAHASSPFRGLLLSLTPMLRRRKAARTPAQGESLSLASSSLTLGPDEGHVMVVEVGAAGLQFGAREYLEEGRWAAEGAPPDSPFTPTGSSTRTGETFFTWPSLPKGAI